MDLTGITINNQYALIKKIAEGRTSSLYLTDCTGKKAEPVVIKIFKDDSTSKKAEDIIRFKKELNIISKLEHPNIIRIYDTGEIFELQYIAMEYIQGASLSGILKNTSLSVELIIDVIIQTCEALDCLHQNGIVHRDLKPGNLIMYEGVEAAGTRIKLTDSGSMCIKNFGEPIKSEDITDILGYLSPEQSGIRKRPVDERSDLYSLGVLFYQLLTGRLPFTGDDLFSLLHHYSARLPEYPSRFSPALPPLLDRMVLKLLDKEPENRYQSARGLLFDLERYQCGDREFILGLNDTSIRLSYRTRFTGRHKELDKLKRIFDRTRNGHGGLCLIRGEAGIGKTRLIEELHYYIRSKDTIVIHAKCFSEENKEPYRLLKDALDEYLKIFRSYPDKRKKEIRNSIRAAVGVLGEAILKLNPRMKEILERCPSMVPLEPERENARFLVVASQFFISLSCIENGLVLSIDDLQWCDEGTLELLARIVNDASQSPFLVIGTFRHDEIAGSQGLIKFVRDAENTGKVLAGITIEHLGGSAMNTFVSGLLYDNEINIKEISDFIHQKSKGNPFFAIEILKQLVEEKALYYRDNKWDIDHTILWHAVIPASIIDILIKRISNLSPEEATVLSYAAVAGKSFEFELLFRLLGTFDKKELVRIIDACIQLQLIDKDIHAIGRLSFVHDRIQEAFYGNIDFDARRDMHARIAETLEDMYADNKKEVLFELAHHYIESGNKDKSLEYAYPASFKAADNFANEDALKYFNIAIELLNEKISSGYGSAHPLWMKSKEGMARVYLRIGRYDEAIDIFNELLPFEDIDINRAHILRDLSSAYHKKGDWANSEKYAKIGIELLGGTLPIKRVSVIVSLIKELLVHCVHLLLPGIFITKRPNPKAGRKMARRIFDKSLIITYMLSERLKYIRAVLRVLNQAEKYFGEGQPFARALNAYGSLLMSLTRFKDALKYYYKSLAISTEINEQHCIGRSYQLIGLCHEWQAEFGPAIENYHKAIDVYTMIGDSNEIGMTLNGLSNIYFFLADFDKLKTTNEKFLAIAYKSVDNYQICNALVLVAFFYMGTGQYDAAMRYALKTYDLSYEYKVWMPHCIINIVLGQLYINTNDIEKAIAHFKKAKELYERHGFLKHYTIHLYPCMADAYIVEYLSKKEITREQRKFYIKRIKKSCKVALRKTKRWTAHHNKSLLVNAKYYALINNNKKAKNFFLQSIDHCSRLGIKLEMANSLYEYGQFLSQTGGEETSRKSFEKAYQIFREIGSTLYSERLRAILGIQGETEDSTSIQKHVYNKRLSSLDRISNEINQISDPEPFFSAVIETALVITSAQKGYLFIVNDNDELELKSFLSIGESDEHTCSNEIIEKVFLSGRPIITESILSIPIRTPERIIGVCYLENSASNGAFADNDVDLITMFMAKIAASINYIFLYMKLKSPKDDNRLAITSSNEEKINKVISYIKENYQRDISREGLASLIDANPDYLGRCFKQYTGLKISEFINKVRVEEAAKKLRETNEKVIDIAYSVGFENLSTFNKTFFKVMKTVPSQYRNKG